jgi:hypothetical protein
MFFCCVCSALSGRGLCDELITHQEESYWLCCNGVMPCWVCIFNTLEGVRWVTCSKRSFREVPSFQLALIRWVGRVEGTGSSGWEANNFSSQQGTILLKQWKRYRDPSCTNCLNRGTDGANSCISPVIICWWLWERYQALHSPVTYEAAYILSQILVDLL